MDRRGVTFGQARAPRGAFTFDGTYTGSALADLMLGYVKSASVNPAHTLHRPAQHLAGLFRERRLESDAAADA